MANELEYEEVKTVSTPFFGLKNDEPVIVKILEKFKVGRKNPSKPEMEPGQVALCLIVKTVDGKGQGSKVTVGFPTIAYNSITESYKDGGYVERLFRLTKTAKTGGGKANPVAVSEVKLKK